MFGNKNYRIPRILLAAAFALSGGVGCTREPLQEGAPLIGDRGILFGHTKAGALHTPLSNCCQHNHDENGDRVDKALRVEKHRQYTGG